MRHAVTLIPGDGIGPEVTGGAVQVLAATGVEIDWDVWDVGLPAVAAGSDPLPDGVLASIRERGVALKGPVSTPMGPGAFPSVNVGLRRELGLHSQVRPCRSRPGIRSPFASVDLVVIRQTGEDLYAGVEFAAGSPGAAQVIVASRSTGHPIPDEAGISVKYATAHGVRQSLEFAFAWAAEHDRPVVTVVHKAAVMRCTDGIFLDVARQVAAAHPRITLDTITIDNLCGQLVRAPERFGVLAMGVQYGDIVSDLGAGLVGGVGMVPGANHGPGVAVFEPAHGTFPRAGGSGRANPAAAILCAVMLLEHLGEHSAAGRVEAAVDRVLGERRWVTYDLRTGKGRPASTDEMTRAVIDAVTGG